MSQSMPRNLAPLRSSLQRKKIRLPSIRNWSDWSSEGLRKQRRSRLLRSQRNLLRRSPRDLLRRSQRSLPLRNPRSLQLRKGKPQSHQSPLHSLLASQKLPSQSPLRIASQRWAAARSVEYVFLPLRLMFVTVLIRCFLQVKMNRMRLRIAERLKQSQNTAASLTTFNEVDMSSLMEFRKLYKDDVLKKTGVKLGFMSAFSRACVLAMKDIPAVNASIEGPNGGDTIVYRDFVDISVAVATEKGLVTPVVRNSETKDLVGIEQAIADLGKKVCPRRPPYRDMY